MSIKTLASCTLFIGLFLIQGCGTILFGHRSGKSEKTEQEKARMACERELERKEKEMTEREIGELAEKECSLDNFDENGERIEKDEGSQESESV